jgi:hypothetical protein
VVILAVEIIGTIGKVGAGAGIEVGIALGIEAFPSCAWLNKSSR